MRANADLGLISALLLDWSSTIAAAHPVPVSFMRSAALTNAMQTSKRWVRNSGLVPLGILKSVSLRSLKSNPLFPQSEIFSSNASFTQSGRLRFLNRVHGAPHEQSRAEIIAATWSEQINTAVGKCSASVLWFGSSEPQCL